MRDDGNAAGGRAATPPADGVAAASAAAARAGDGRAAFFAMLRERCSLAAQSLSPQEARRVHSSASSQGSSPPRAPPPRPTMTEVIVTGGLLPRPPVRQAHPARRRGVEPATKQASNLETLTLVDLRFPDGAAAGGGDAGPARARAHGDLAAPGIATELIERPTSLSTSRRWCGRLRRSPTRRARQRTAHRRSTRCARRRRARASSRRRRRRWRRRRRRRRPRRRDAAAAAEHVRLPQGGVRADAQRRVAPRLGRRPRAAAARRVVRPGAPNAAPTGAWSSSCALLAGRDTRCRCRATGDAGGELPGGRRGARDAARRRRRRRARRRPHAHAAGALALQRRAADAAARLAERRGLGQIGAVTVEVDAHAAAVVGGMARRVVSTAPPRWPAARRERRRDREGYAADYL